MLLRKSLSRKDIYLNMFLMQTKVPYSGGKVPQKTFISKKGKWEPGFKAGRDRLSLLFCANAVGFRIRTDLIYKAANPWALEGKFKHQLPVFRLYYNMKVWTTRTLFLDWFHRCLFLKVRKYLASKGLFFRVLLTQDNALDHPEPHEFNTKGVEVVNL